MHTCENRIYYRTGHNILGYRKEPKVSQLFSLYLLASVRWRTNSKSSLVFSPRLLHKYYLLLPTICLRSSLHFFYEYLLSRHQVKKAALDIVRGLTGSDGGIETLVSCSDFVLSPLCRLLRDNPELAVPAAEALINLTQNPTLAEKLVSLRAVDTAMEVIYKQGGSDGRLSKLLVMLLVNLTQLDSGISSLLQVGDDKIEGLYLSKLVRSFCRSSSSDATEGTYEHVASIIVNVSKMEAGRRILLQPKGSLLKQIIRQSDSANPLRKKGVLGTIRNCCFDADRQLQNLFMLSEFLWPALLLPVAGKKSYSEQDTAKMPLELANALSHEREPVDDPEIRKQALEALYLIALQDAGRSALWSVNGPRILQLGYEDEEDPKVMEAFELIGSLVVINAGSEEQLDSMTE